MNVVEEDVLISGACAILSASTMKRFWICKGCLNGLKHKDNIQAMLKAIKKKKEYLIDDIAPQKMLSGLELNENVNHGNSSL